MAGDYLDDDRTLQVDDQGSHVKKAKSNSKKDAHGIQHLEARFEGRARRTNGDDDDARGVEIQE